MADGNLTSLTRIAPTTPNDRVAAIIENLAGLDGTYDRKYEVVTQKAVVGFTEVCNEATVNDSSAQAIAANSKRVLLEVRNYSTSGQIIYLSQGVTPATTSYWPLEPGESQMYRAETTKAIYAIASAAGAKLRYREVSIA